MEIREMELIDPVDNECKAYWSKEFWKDHSPELPLMLDDDRERRITNQQAFLTYHLLRGGISDIAAISAILLIPMVYLSTLNLDKLFVWFDNELFHYDPPRADLPKGGAKIFCGQCGSRLVQLPCEGLCKVADYALRPRRANILGREWQDRDDRHWKGVGRIEQSERDYHGSIFS